MNCDFEKSIHSAVRATWENCQIRGCFFHLCKAWLSKVKALGLYKNFLIDPNFRDSFRLCQALAYIPESDVELGFDQISYQAPFSFKPVLEYIERVYIRKIDDKTKEKKQPRYPIATLNINLRILSGLPTSNNPVESWHGALTVII